MPKVLYRALRYFYRRWLAKRNQEEVFTLIYKNNYWSGISSVSGTGSDPEQTKAICLELNPLIKQLHIESFLDLPCGDHNWIKNAIPADVQYIGGDIVKELIVQNTKVYSDVNKNFHHMNLLIDKLPDIDLMFCRDCLVHFSYSDIFQALSNICRSDIKYIFLTTFNEREFNSDIVTGKFRPLNLQKPPFNFPEPLTVINEGCSEGGGKFGDKSLALWRISDIRKLLKN